MANIVRITSGKYRGRKLLTPGGATHPMGERERLALFNMISPYLAGATILDAFAGSGALGIEALSRGAKEVLFVEKSHVAMRTIADNCMALGIPENQVASYRGTVDAFSEEIMRGHGIAVLSSGQQVPDSFQTSFDIVLADPPYDDFNVPEVASLVHILKPGGLFVLSHPGEAPEIQGMKLVRTNHYAGARITIYELA